MIVTTIANRRRNINMSQRHSSSEVMSVPIVVRAARLPLLLPAVAIIVSIAMILQIEVHVQSFTVFEEMNVKRHARSSPIRTRRYSTSRPFGFHHHGSYQPSKRCLLPIDSPSSTATATTARRRRSRTPTTLQLQGYEADLMPSIATPFTITIVALIIGVAAQTFINKMLEGDQGLGAFLSDGTGFNRSGFRPTSSPSSSSSPFSKGKDGGKNNGDKDPLPWLKLPRLDFVDVAGQPPPPPKGLQLSDNKKMQTNKNQIQITGMNIPTIDSTSSSSAGGVYEELEQLRIRLIREVQEENVKEATKLQKLLEQRMKEEGIQFTTTTTTTSSSTSTPSQSSQQPVSPPASDRLKIDDDDDDDDDDEDSDKTVIDNGIDFQ